MQEKMAAGDLALRHRNRIFWHRRGRKSSSAERGEATNRKRLNDSTRLDSPRQMATAQQLAVSVFLGLNIAFLAGTAIWFRAVHASPVSNKFDAYLPDALLVRASNLRTRVGDAPPVTIRQPVLVALTNLPFHVNAPVASSPSF